MPFELNRIRAVLWDLDDTLFSRVEAAKCTFRQLYREKLYASCSEEQREEILEYRMQVVTPYSQASRESFERLFAKYPPETDVTWEELMQYYADHVASFSKPYEEHIRIVKKLKSMGIKQAIVTNCLPDRIPGQRMKIHNMGFEELFDVIILSGEVGITKPDPGIYHLAAQKLGVDAKECLFVGDSTETDIPGAIAAGMPSILYDYWNAGKEFENEPSVTASKNLWETFFGKET